MKSRKQAIAIGLSEARKEGKKVPKKKTAARKKEEALTSNFANLFVTEPTNVYAMDWAGLEGMSCRKFPVASVPFRFSSLPPA